MCQLNALGRGPRCTCPSRNLRPPGFHSSLLLRLSSCVVREQQISGKRGPWTGQKEKESLNQRIPGHQSWAGPTGHLVQQSYFTGLFYIFILFLSSGWRGSVTRPRSRSTIPVIPTIIIIVITIITIAMAAGLCGSLPDVRLHLLSSSRPL